MGHSGRFLSLVSLSQHQRWVCLSLVSFCMPLHHVLTSKACYRLYLHRSRDFLAFAGACTNTVSLLQRKGKPSCFVLQDALVIGSRFEVDASTAMCRLAFYGRLAALIDHSDPEQMRRVRIFKVKRRSGSIDRVDKDGLGAVCKGMFKKETDITVFAGLKVSTSPDSWRQAELPFLVLQH